ncbi:MAG: Stp1/IreP family PP2C-type Ser/Thr phosphatase [Raineya sp.]|jgi:serine/threonine protein phosphatase PrpC|nr:Stp1/IreP family PP2C-type Ser/Thr phosphatase [Raineya sp.]
METNTQELKNFEFGNATDVGCKRDNNEDYLGYFQTQNGHLFVVCDGMGGHQAGEKASQLTVEVFKRYFTAGYYPNASEALEKATIEANKIVFETSQKYTEYAGMGTTLVAVLIRDNQVFYVHVGDSRLYLYEQETQKLHRITKDHSFVQQLVDNGIISDLEAESHPRKNEILRALGVNSVVEPEVGISAILPADNDLLLLCSDGLNSMILDAQIQSVIADNSLNILQRTKNLIESAKQAGGYDNITVQLIRFYAQNRKKTVLPSHHIKNNTEEITEKKTENNSLNIKKILPITLLLIGLIAFGIWYVQNKNPFVEKAKQLQDSIKIQKDTLKKSLFDEEKEKERQDSLKKDSIKNIEAEKKTEKSVTKEKTNPKNKK